MPKIINLEPLIVNGNEQSVKVVRAGVMTEVYVMEKFQRQSISKSDRLNLFRRADNALRAKRMVRWLSVANGDPGTAYFFTATFADEVKDYDDALARWEKFRRLIIAEFPSVRYVAVPEVQPRSGRWHFHALLCGLPQIRALKKRYGKMRSADGRSVDKWLYRFTEVWSEANGGQAIHRANIEVARSVAGVCRYLSKYLTKDTFSSLPKNEKAYFCARGLLRPSDHFTDKYPDSIIKTLELTKTRKYIKTKVICKN